VEKKGVKQEMGIQHKVQSLLVTTVVVFHTLITKLA